ncbi:UNVERIFIED_CONTAM: hypothetical protein Sindi_0715800 [Sesamum indicum]
MFRCGVDVSLEGFYVEVSMNESNEGDGTHAFTTRAKVPNGGEVKRRRVCGQPSVHHEMLVATLLLDPKGSDFHMVVNGGRDYNPSPADFNIDEFLSLANKVVDGDEGAIAALKYLQIRWENKFGRSISQRTATALVIGKPSQCLEKSRAGANAQFGRKTNGRDTDLLCVSSESGGQTAIEMMGRRPAGVGNEVPVSFPVNRSADVADVDADLPDDIIAEVIGSGDVTNYITGDITVDYTTDINADITAEFITSSLQKILVDPLKITNLDGDNIPAKGSARPSVHKIGKVNDVAYRGEGDDVASKHNVHSSPTGLFVGNILLHACSNPIIDDKIAYAFNNSSRKTLSYVASTIQNVWPGLHEVTATMNEFFFFQFKTVAYMEEVIEGGPWLYQGQPIVLQKWEPGMVMQKLKHTQVPIWIKLRHLPVELWTEEGLSTVANGIGKSLYQDTIARECTRLDFARVWIDMEYEWLPPRYTSCMTLGHSAKDYATNKIPKPTKAPVSVYIPKTGAARPPPMIETRSPPIRVVEQQREDSAPVINAGPSREERAIWNVRGLNKRDHQLAVKGIVAEFRALHEDVLITVVYGATDVPDRWELWSTLEMLALQCADIPWLIGGDFNAVRDMSEGEWYTWHNRSASPRNLWKRLDRMLINDTWTARFPVVFYSCLTPRTSDHLPLIVYAKAAKMEPIMLQQRAKMAWMKGGDKCSRVFFRKIAQRRTSRRIMQITDALGVTHTQQNEVIHEFVSYYQSLLGGERRQQVLDLRFIRTWARHILTEDEMMQLVAPFTANDVKIAVFDIAEDKAPGPDGYSSGFYKAAWPVVGNEVMKAVLDFFSTGRLLKQVNSTLLALIPKVHSPKSIGDFRSISCCNVLYKIIAKLIVQRLSMVLDKIVSPCQGAFIPGWSIGDNILLAQELFTGYNQVRRPPRCAMKVDIRKAYDTVEWDFLFSVLQLLGFPEGFTRWIEECVTTPSFSVGMNGQPYGFFTGARGLRQGDPLSPYLFVLVMEVLHLGLLQLIEQDMHFTFHWKCEAARIFQLGFADDLLLFCRATIDSIRVLKSGLDRFATWSRLRLNVEKSHLIISRSAQGVKEEMLAILGFQEGHLPMRYLGLPLLSSRLTISDCQPLLIKIAERINGWEGLTLSCAGRVQIIKSVLMALNVYWSSAFILSKEIVKEIEKRLRAFLWKGRSNSGYAKVSWKEVCKPKEEGGQGIQEVGTLNQALMCKKLCEVIRCDRTSIWSGLVISWATQGGLHLDFTGA